eukprot:GHVL01019606.1.p1 GENE.GHVL01019606.1~~GHVL01019606.1.p1  ORF type:complete len:157 (-),score=27.35 GHVL01019606.1:186-656(-)
MSLTVGSVCGKEEEPSAINCRNHPIFLEVEKDKLSVKYVGKGNHSDYGCVQSNCPAPRSRVAYYFEVTVVDVGNRAALAIGLTDRLFLNNRQPGWEPDTYGYKAEDGKKFISSSRGEAYGPPFGKNDTVGNCWRSDISLRAVSYSRSTCARRVSKI